MTLQLLLYSPFPELDLAIQRSRNLMTLIPALQSVLGTECAAMRSLQYALGLSASP